MAVFTLALKILLKNQEFPRKCEHGQRKWLSCLRQVVWSEVTFFVKSPVLSLFAVFLQSASISNSGMVVFLSGLTISYLCLCAYYTIFRIKIFNYYYIASGMLHCL